MTTIRMTMRFGQVRGLAVAGMVALGASAGLAQKTAVKSADQPAVTVEVAAPIAEAQRLVELEDAAVEAFAAGKGFDSAEFSIVHSAVSRYPMQGVTAYAYKIMDAKDGALGGVVIDEAGLVLDPAELQVAEQAAYEAAFGKLHPDLANVLPLVGETELVPVILWLKDDSAPVVERPDPSAGLSKSEAELFAAEVDGARRRFIEAAAEPVVRALADIGIEAATDAYAPVVYAELDPATIDEVARLPDVAMVYLDKVNESGLGTARITTRAHTVNDTRGITGTGVKVGVIEVGGKIMTGNPHLTLRPGLDFQDATYSCSNAHADAVTGVVRSNHATHLGIACTSQVWVGGSCGGLSSQLQNRATAAADWGARVINNSWVDQSGSRVPDVDARFFDNMVINRYRTVVFCAGNRGGPGCLAGTDGIVTNPAIGYNVIAVGNFNDRGLPYLMNPCSSWKDPISAHGDREKPELAAPGTDIVSTLNVWPWIGGIGSGTSFAAPMVTGGAALLIQRNSGLSSWPEAVKAILMATAMTNIEGDSRLSEKDGAGGMQLDRADDVARRFRGNWGAQGYTCGSAATLDVMSMTLAAGKKTRVVIVWDTDPAYTSYASQPCADLDLQVIRPTTTGFPVLASSDSFDNTYEIVEFTPTVAGVHKIRVNKFRCDLSPRYLGYAWYQMP